MPFILKKKPGGSMGRLPNFWWIISTLVIAGHFDGKNDAIRALNFEFPFLSMY